MWVNFLIMLLALCLSTLQPTGSWQRVRLLEGSFLQVLLGVKMVIYQNRYRDKL